MKGAVYSSPPGILGEVQAIRPDVAPDTLGYRTVVQDIFAVAEEQKYEAGGVDMPDLRHTIDARRENIHQGLGDVRRRMVELEGAQTNEWNFYCNTGVPPFLEGVRKTISGRRKDWAEWLGREATDERLLNFLQWHNHALGQLMTEPAIAREVNLQKEAYIQAVVRGIEDGWLHPDAQAAVEKAQRIKVYGGDLFDTRFQDKGGYHVRGSGRVVAATIGTWLGSPHYEHIRGNLRRTTKHEFNHAVLGQFDVRWLDEAITEHIALAMDYGAPDSLEAWARSLDRRSAYEEERELLRCVLEEGEESIPVRMSTRAYSEDKDNGEEKAAFKEAVDRSWAHLTPEGESAFDNLNKYMESLEEQIREEQGCSMISAGRQASILTRRRFKHYQGLLLYRDDPERYRDLHGTKAVNLIEMAEERLRAVFSTVTS